MISKAIIALVLLPVFLLLKFPIEKLLLSLEVSSFYSNYLSSIIIRILILIGSFYMIRGSKFEAFDGFTVKRKKTVIVCLLLLPVIYFLVSRYSSYRVTDPFSLITYLSFSLLVAVAEEMFFRGYLLPAFLKGSRSMILSVITTAVLFGLVHYINLIKQPDNFAGISRQVFLAAAVGVVFAAMQLRLKHIAIVSIIHFLINLAIGTNPFMDSNTASAPSPQSNGGSGVILILTLVGIISALGFLLVPYSKKKTILRELDEA